MKAQRGETLIGFMAAILIVAIVMAGVVQGMVGVSRSAEDSRMITDTNGDARALLDLMSYELRFAGSGVPFYQTDFHISSATLGDSVLPILTSSSTTEITFRMNTRGIVGHLANDFDPAAQTTITLTSNPGITAGDTIYISNLVVAGSGGYRGVVDSVVGTTISVVAAGSTYTPGEIYSAGSLLEPVQTITYANTAGGVTRTVNAEVTSLGDDTSFTLQYLDGSGTALALPLTAAVMQNNLASLRLTVSRPSSRPLLSTDETYTAELTARIALRELNVLR